MNSVPIPTDRAKYLGLDGQFVIAHRGGGEEAPENSKSAIEHTLAAGVPVVESDVHATSDGIAVLMHDPRLDRTTNAMGRVSSYTWKQIQKIQDRSGFPPISLEQALLEFPSLRFNIDVKSDRVVEPFIDVMRRVKAFDQVNVASFSNARLRRVRAALPEIESSLGTGDIVRLIAASKIPLEKGLRAVSDLPGVNEGAHCVQVPFRWHGVPVTTDSLINLVHSRGQQLHVWTVNRPAHITQLYSHGVDAVITDVPLAASKLLSQLDA